MSSISFHFLFLPWCLRCYRFLYTYSRSYCNFYLGGVASGKGLYLMLVCMHLPLFFTPKLMLPGIKEWRLITDSWLLCSPVDCVPHLNHRHIAEVYVGNFLIRYRTGSSRFVIFIRAQKSSWEGWRGREQRDGRASGDVLSKEYQQSLNQDYIHA